MTPLTSLTINCLNQTGKTITLTIESDKLDVMEWPLVMAELKTYALLHSDEEFIKVLHAINNMGFVKICGKILEEPTAMKFTSIEASVSRTIPTGAYNSLKLSMGAGAELAEGDDPDKCMSELVQWVEVSLRDELNRVLPKKMKELENAG